MLAAMSRWFGQACVNCDQKQIGEQPGKCLNNKEKNLCNELWHLLGLGSC